jgi:hypothetical protein
MLVEVGPGAGLLADGLQHSVRPIRKTNKSSWIVVAPTENHRNPHLEEEEQVDVSAPILLLSSSSFSVCLCKNLIIPIKKKINIKISSRFG